jgi:hypothetical protein
VRIVGAVVVGLVLAAGIRTAGADDSLMDRWFAYDYQPYLQDPQAHLHLDAIRTGDAVWTHGDMWSIDDPESPPSILALMRYGPERDFRGACFQFDLIGMDLELHGATVSLWVVSSDRGERWHAKVPLVIEDDWTPQRVDVDAVDWRQSWSRTGNRSLERTLADGDSFGIGFVGFSEEPSGAVGMRRMRLGC